MDRQEVIEGLNRIHTILDGMLWKGQKTHPEKLELLEILVSAKSLLQAETMGEREIKKIIKEHQIDIGHHRYGNMQEKKLKDCCNVDIDNLAQALLHKLPVMDKERLGQIIFKFVCPTEIERKKDFAGDLATAIMNEFTMR